MDTRKLMLKISYGLNAVLILAVAGLVVYQQRLIRQMPKNEDQAPLAAAVSDTDTRPRNDTQTAPVPIGGQQQLAAEVDDLRYQLEASEEELDMAREDLEKKQGGIGDISELIAMEKKMRENPSVMNMKRRMQENMIAEMYGALFERLGLPDDKMQGFKTLMVDYQMQMEEVSLGLMDQSISEDERKENAQLMDDQKAEFEKQARELLGSETYEKYEAYEERLRERQFVSGIINNLSADLGLSDEKEQELIDAMYTARKAVQARHGIDPSNIAQTIGSADQDPQEAMDRQLEIYDSYVESAEGVLSESQTDQFEARINEMKEMQKISRSFLEGGDDDS